MESDTPSGRLARLEQSWARVWDIGRFPSDFRLCRIATVMLNKAKWIKAQFLETKPATSQRSCGCPLPGSAQGQVGWSSEHPGQAEDVPAHGRGVGTR